jgi:hypothetical protein
MEITANVVDYEYFLEKLKSLETTNTAESSSALHALFPSNTSSHFSQVNQNGYGLVH